MGLLTILLVLEKGLMDQSIVSRLATIITDVNYYYLHVYYMQVAVAQRVTLMILVVNAFKFSCHLTLLINMHWLGEFGKHSHSEHVIHVGRASFWKERSGSTHFKRITSQVVTYISTFKIRFPNTPTLLLYILRYSSLHYRLQL